MLRVKFVAGAALQCQSEASTIGAAAVSVSTQALSAADVDRVQMTITGPDIEAAIVFDLVRSESEWFGLIEQIPSGIDRTFSAEAFDADGTVVYDGVATGVVITPGTTAAVLLVLQQSTPPDAGLNTPPFIDSVMASSAVVSPGAQVSVVVQARDEDGDALTFAWTATDGVFSAPTTTNPIWTAPLSEGLYLLSVAVSDVHGAIRQVSFAIEVLEAAATGGAEVRVTVNTWPTIEEVSASPTRIQAGESTSLAVTASDNDGNPLTYAWSDSGGDCAGSFDDASAPQPTWTAPATSPAAASCPLTVTVSDNAGGSHTGTIVVFVGELEPINYGPSIAGTFQGAASAPPDHTILFRVIASDPEGQPLDFRWNSAAGN